MFVQNLTLTLLVVVFLIVAIREATAESSELLRYAFQDVKIELFLDNDADDPSPCASSENFTMVFKEMRLDTGQCITHLFPHNTDDDSEKWLQFSARALIRPDGGLQMWLYFTRDELTGAVTYCAEENIQNLPYPLEVTAMQSDVCQIIKIPKFDLGDGEEDRTMAMRLTFDTQKVAKLLKIIQTTPSTLESTGRLPFTSILLWLMWSVSLLTSLL